MKKKSHLNLENLALCVCWLPVVRLRGRRAAHVTRRAVERYVHRRDLLFQGTHSSRLWQSLLQRASRVGRRG